MSRTGVLLVLLASLAATHVLARPLASQSATIPYHGTLELDGHAAEGHFDFEFRLYPSTAATTAIWCERQGNVRAAQGQFAVLLGSGTACAGSGDLDAAMRASSGELFLRITVRPHSTDAGAPYTALQGQQRLASVPFAHHGAPKSDLAVDRNLTVGPNAPAYFTTTGAGNLYVDQAAQFGCSSCGSNSGLTETGGDWGDLVVQGRVLSTSANLHLSPPSGFNVIINDTYRAAGGTSGGEGAGLLVQRDLSVGRNATVTGSLNAGSLTTGNLTATGLTATSLNSPSLTTDSLTTTNLTATSVTGRLAPDYNSGWRPVSNSPSREELFAHGLSAPPSRIVLQQCGAVSNGACTTRIVMASEHGISTTTAFVNPVNVTLDATNVYVGISNSRAVWAYWTPADWGCPDDADSNCNTGYYRVLAWR